ncbi:MAG: cell envelope integrity protein CreD [Gammaproteobacteria bacterium]|nr:cell envelope integrity protein CreD [Gammaproteobacteria bacterium]
MRNPFNSSSRSASVKAAIVAFLTLVLLIPMGMIEGVIIDRQNNASVATIDIRNSWGGDQTVTGPILSLPYTVNKKTVYGSAYTEEHVVQLLAEELIVTADVATEIRYRGIHEVPVFSADIDINGKIDLGALATLGIMTEQVAWTGAEILLGISDPKAISKTPVIVTNGSRVNFTSGGDGIEGLASQLSAAVGKQLTALQSQSELTFDISVAVNGSGSLQFLPLAENVSVTMSSNWASPSFTGRQLPTGRDIRDDGFDAAWHVTSLGRQLPAVWIDSHAAQVSVAADAFGTRFIQPVGFYQLIERATKYAVLFIGLTFVTYFLIEVVGNLRLHPLQYLLVGLANTLFYLLLLSLSEHVGFDIAYLVSALASAALISGYSAAILVRRARAVAMAAVLTGLYAFLYLTLNAENFALLAGSIGLWIVLALVMYLTRGINWYAAAAVDQSQTTAD